MAQVAARYKRRMTAESDVRTHLHLPGVVAEALARGATILTPNQRAAHSLRQAFDSESRRRGEKLWPVPAILALDSWLSSLWTQLLLSGAEDRLLLNRSQEHVLWRSILARDQELTGLQSLENLAILAADAWQRLQLYRGQSRLRQAAESPDTQAFARWAAEFESLCTHRRYLSAASLPFELVGAVGGGSLKLPAAGLALVDFSRHAPAHALLFDSLERAGYAVVALASTLPDFAGELHTAEDDTSELRAAAQWLRKRILGDPSARLALIVSNLAERRADVDRALADIFGSTLFDEQGAPAYEFSLGQPLAETAVGSCALMLLRWALGALPVASISRLLLSPFFGALNPALAAATAEFDAFELRHAKLLRPQLQIHQCVQMIEQSRRRDPLAPLVSRLKEAGRRLLDAKSVKSPAGWADEFRALLSLYGWAAATDRDSLSYQVRQRWEGALAELSTLDFDNALVSPSTALDMLSRIASATIFAPESQNAPIQVIGPLEVGGLPFDAIWFLGADDQGWPLPAALHPLLPWPLQHALGMPGGDPERDAEAGRAFTRQIAGAATRVIFSYARNGEDQLRRPSPLVVELLLQPHVDATSEHEPALRLESFEECEALPPLPDRVSHGGARLLQLQAACSFRAFAEIRLSSAEPEDQEQGFDARESGTVIHLVMQHFWGIAVTQQALHDMSDDARHDLLRQSIQTALEPTLVRAQTDWERAYLNVQRNRLFHLLKPWLEIELARPPFTVRVREKSVEDISIGALRLKLRVDRVDDTAGGPLIIDYKSGRASYKDWAGDRPDAPQLPLYGVLTEGEHLGGLAFAKLRAGKGMGLEGLAEDPDVLDSKPMAMPMREQVQQWRKVLESLAQEFALGAAAVNPKDYPHTCQYCSQRLLCRLDVSALASHENSETHEETQPEDGIYG